jgi:hypothetical protein
VLGRSERFRLLPPAALRGVGQLAVVAAIFGGAGLVVGLRGQLAWFGGGRVVAGTGNEPGRRSGRLKLDRGAFAGPVDRLG